MTELINIITTLWAAFFLPIAILVAIDRIERMKLNRLLKRKRKHLEEEEYKVHA